MKTKQVVIIAGGSGGIGSAIADLLSADHQLILIGHNINKIEPVAQRIGAQSIVADISDYQSINKIVGQIQNQYGQVDVAINCAGRLIDGALDQLDVYEIQQLIATNILGAIYFSKAVLPRMKELNRGKIIHIVSQAGLVARKYRSVYNASKWALRGFGLSLQEEVAKYQIAVSLIHPGLVDTPLLQKAGVDSDPERSLTPAQVARCVKFVVDSDRGVVIPEIGVKSLRDF